MHKGKKRTKDCHLCVPLWLSQGCRRPHGTGHLSVLQQHPFLWTLSHTPVHLFLTLHLWLVLHRPYLEGKASRLCSASHGPTSTQTSSVMGMTAALLLINGALLTLVHRCPSNLCSLHFLETERTQPTPEVTTEDLSATLLSRAYPCPCLEIWGCLSWRWGAKGLEQSWRVGCCNTQSGSSSTGVRERSHDMCHPPLPSGCWVLGW